MLKRARPRLEVDLLHGAERDEAAARLRDAVDTFFALQAAAHGLARVPSREQPRYVRGVLTAFGVDPATLEEPPRPDTQRDLRRLLAWAHRACPPQRGPT
jgi:hypothetical protein